MRSTVRSRIALAAGVLLGTGPLLATAGCSSVGAGGPAYDLSGAWGGTVTAGGQQLYGNLQVEQDAEILSVSFSSAEGVDAQGTGAIASDGSVTIELTYDLGCPGTAKLLGQVDEDGNRLSGQLSATDCNGTMEGTFSFQRAR